MAEPEPGPEAQDEGDETWFDADQLASSSAVELIDRVDRVELIDRVDPIEGELAIAGLLPGPDAAQLRVGLAAPRLSLGTLPGWPGSGAQGAGWGETLDGLTGGLRPGWIGLVTAATRGAGRSALLSQLADGLAARGETPPRGPITPVLICSEEGAWCWRARSLARWSGEDPRVFSGVLAVADASAQDRLDAALGALVGPTGGLRSLVGLQRFVADPGPREQASERLAELAGGVRRWRAELADRCGRPPEEIWPILVLDPIGGVSLEQLRALVDREGWAALVSADAPEPSASRSIDRWVDLRLELRSDPDSSDDDAARLEVEIAFARLGPRGRVSFGWDRRSGRLES